MNEFLKSPEKNDEQGLPQEVLVEMENLIKVEYPFEGYEGKKKIWAKNVAKFLKNNPKAVGTFFGDFLKQWGGSQLNDFKIAKKAIEDLSLVVTELARLASDVDKE